MLLKAASLLVALFALLGFVAAAGAGAKEKKHAVDAGSPKADGGQVVKIEPHREFFPASKSPGHFYPREQNPPPVQQQQQSPAQQQK